jgi:hypothetical protein
MFNRKRAIAAIRPVVLHSVFLSVAGPVQAHLVDQGRGPHDGQIWLRRPRLNVNRKAGLLRRPALV